MMRLKEEFEKTVQFSLKREDMFRKGFIEGAKYVFDELDRRFNEYGVLKSREFEEVENKTVINIKNKIVGVFDGKEKGQEEKRHSGGQEQFPKEVPNLWTPLEE